MQVNIGRSIELTVDETALSPEVMQHVVYIGLRNILMDSHAGAAKIAADDGGDVNAIARAMAEKKLAALVAGELRTTSSREGDPIRAEAIRMATATIHGLIRKAGKKIADYDAKAIREKAVAMLTPELLAQAKARVDEVRNVAAGTSLDDLGL